MTNNNEVKEIVYIGELAVKSTNGASHKHIDGKPVVIFSGQSAKTYIDNLVNQACIDVLDEFVDWIDLDDSGKGMYIKEDLKKFKVEKGLTK